MTDTAPAEVVPGTTLEEQVKAACIEGVMQGVRGVVAYTLENPAISGAQGQQRIANLRANAMILLSIIDTAFTPPVEEDPDYVAMLATRSGPPVN